jgi:hypothetical protein
VEKTNCLPKHFSPWFHSVFAPSIDDFDKIGQEISFGTAFLKIFFYEVRNFNGLWVLGEGIVFA